MQNAPFNNVFVNLGGSGGGTPSTPSSLYALPAPKIAKVSKSDGTNTYLDYVDMKTDPANYNSVPDVIYVKDMLNLITSNLTTDQITKGVWLEMVLYKRGTNRPSKTGSIDKQGPAFITPPDVIYDSINGNYNPFAQQIQSLYPNFVMSSRGGVPQGLATNLNYNQTSHLKIQSFNENIPLADFFQNRLTKGNVGYINQSGSYSFLPNCYHPYQRFAKNTNGTYGLSTKKHIQRKYESKLNSLKVKFRFIMVDEEANGGKGLFIEGPTTEVFYLSPTKQPLVVVFDPTLEGGTGNWYAKTNGFSPTEVFKFTVGKRN